MASKTPPINKTRKIAPVAIELPAAAVVADVAPKFKPTQAVSAPKLAPAAPLAAPVVSAPAPAPVAKEKAAANAAPIVPAIATQTPSVAQTPAEPTKEEIMDNTTTASFDTTAAAPFVEKAKTMFSDVNAKGTKTFADINDFSKGNIEALVESGKIAAKGIEAMGQEAADYGRKQVESATAVLKSLSSVKSPTDFFKLHSDYVRSSFDSMVAQTSKNTEMMLKLAGEVAQPIQNRVAVAVEKVKVAA